MALSLFLSHLSDLPVDIRLVACNLGAGVRRSFLIRAERSIEGATDSNLHLVIACKLHNAGLKGWPAMDLFQSGFRDIKLFNV